MKSLSCFCIDGKITIQIADYIEDGWYIERDESNISPMWELWEIPLYGGEPYLINKFNSLKEALEHSNDLT